MIRGSATCDAASVPLRINMINLSLPLSANFTLGELLRSSTAERDVNLKHEQENPPEVVLLNLQHLVEVALQPIRAGLNYPVRISSGYRCMLLNKLVGGSATSQHVRGEAADCSLSRLFLADERTRAVRDEIRSGVEAVTGRTLRPEVTADGYLFAFACLHLDELDVDQLIHEYGDGFGEPAWVHIAASKRHDRRQILAIGSYTNMRWVAASVHDALSFLT